MEFQRSTKTTLGAATHEKQRKISRILDEYQEVCNFFIQWMWDREWTEDHTKGDLLKEVVNLPEDTWLTARLRKVAAREAYDMIRGVRKRWGSEAVMPRHHGSSMRVSTTIAELQEPEEAEHFDAWLHISSVGDRMVFDVPVKKHQHWNKLEDPPGERESSRNRSYVISENDIQFSFEISTDKEPEPEGPPLGVDTGVNKLATLSDGTKLGTEIRKYINRIKACRDAGVDQTSAIRAMKHYMDRVAKEIAEKKPSQVVVEDLRNMNKNTKKDSKLNKSARKTLGAWLYSYWLERLELTCEWYRVPFARVPAAYTSQRCSKCGHTEGSNRRGERFRCLNCGHEADADVNAAKNILERHQSRDPPES